MIERLRELCRERGMNFEKALKHATGPVRHRDAASAEREAAEAFAQFEAGDRLQVVRCLSALRDMETLK